jgi:ABC-2 type transport system ATP-binding protein
VGAARYIGRIGGLAVALGVGVAIATGAGVASADTDGSSASASSGDRHASRSAKKTSVFHGSKVNATALSGSRVLERRPAKAPSGSMSTSAMVGASGAGTAVVRDVSDPLTGSAPTDPPVDPSMSLTMLAAARRELISPAIDYTPVITLEQGVITGADSAPTSANGSPLTYTVVGAPSAGGKVRLDATDGSFTFLPDASVFTSATKTEQFSVLVAEMTPFDAAIQGIPLIGALAQPILVQLHQAPVVGDLLAPLIGYAVVAPVTVDVGALVPVGTPVAFTTKVISFDGTPISTNFFPALGMSTQPDGTFPTVMLGAGLAGAGNTDPDSQWNPWAGVGNLRDAGYNVVTWDSRGKWDSGGLLQLDSPFFEGRDASAIIDWLATQSGVELDSANDPRMGMAGGSYGGAIQLVTAAIDPRVDAIVPGISWNSLNSSLYPDGAFKASYATLLLLSLVASGARINADLYSGILTGTLLGVLTDSQQAVLASSGPSVLVNRITTPTLLIQGTVDVLFPLQQAVTNAKILDANGIPVKMIWFCGGHGNCLTETGPDVISGATLAWLAKYVKDEDVDTGPVFQWVDQNGQNYTADMLPTGSGFYGGAITAEAAGGLLGIIPLIGGSGPQNQAGFPYSLTNGSEASNALTLTVPPQDAQIVGAPELTLTYSGIGTNDHIYAQIVDDQTGLVVGNLVTPISVTMDGQSHTVTVPLADIAYSMDADPTHTLTLQLVGSATPYLNLTSFGVIKVSDVKLSLPTVGEGIATAV